jgi:hypothetical protein
LPEAQKHKQLLLGAGAGGSILALVALLALVGGDDDAAGQPEANARAAVADAGIAAEEPDILERVVIAASEAVKPAVEAVTPRRGIPDELEDEVDALLQGARIRERREAARKILKHKPANDLYPHLLVIAEFEAARGCGARKDAIEKMVVRPNAQFLPALRRIHRARKTGCGFLSLQDCYDCIRGDVRRAIATIRKGTGSQAEPDD